MGRFTLRFTLVAAFTGVTLLVSLVIGLATSTLVGDFVRDEFRLRLSDLVAVAATQIDVSAHHRLQAPQDQASREYLALRDRLREVRDNGTHIRFIYTTRQRPDGKVIFVVDAEEKPQEFSALGDVYDDVSPELRAALAAPRGTAKAFVTQRFYTDAWGTWMSAYAPLYLPDGTLDAVLGLDMSADRILRQERRYQYVLWGASALLTLLLMPLAYWIAQRIRRPLSRLEADMHKVRQFDLGITPPIRTRVIEINRMVEQLDSMRSGLRSFQKYVPAELVRRLIARGVDAELGGSQQEMTFFMSDVEGFTTLSERLPPDELVHHLGEYLTAVTSSLLDSGATVDQYIGDAVLAFWNAPEPVADHPLRACQAALAAQTAVARLNRSWEAQGRRVAFKTRIGINTGEAIVGNIGSIDRMSYTVIGDQVNLVSRLEATNKFYGTSILLSEHTQQRVREQFATRLVDQLVAYGRSRPIRVYELLGHRGAMAPEVLAMVADYEAAFDHYQRRDFSAAVRLLERHPDDPPARVLLSRCRRYLDHPPLAEWDGSFLFTSK
jgi:class 3 adenylate cyclase